MRNRCCTRIVNSALYWKSQPMPERKKGKEGREGREGGRKKQASKQKLTNQTKPTKQAFRFQEEVNFFADNVIVYVKVQQNHNTRTEPLVGR